jgi:fructose-1,6-bisphosphatase
MASELQVYDVHTQNELQNMTINKHDFKGKQLMSTFNNSFIVAVSFIGG